MTPNPFVALFEDPVATLTAAAYVCVLLGLLVATWWAATRNALYLREEWREGWLMLVPFWYAARCGAMFLILAVDLLLVAGIIALLT